MQRKFLASAVVADATLSDRQIRVVANSGKSDRVGDVLVASGCVLDNYRKNPIVLSGHDRMKPVGTAKVYVAGERLEAVITFAPAGTSKEADEICALSKGGILGAVSVGFRPIEWTPARGGGQKFTSWELLELSVVSVPCDADALIIARSMRSKSGRVLNARNSAAIAEIERCLGKSTEAHEAACELLEKADRHREKARRHAAAIAASQQGGDGDDPDDDDSDQELAYEAERRKREIEIAERASTGSRDADRRARAIEIARLVHSA
jgi:HK97 family phage prohead protease